jgi:hypothetical protein
MNSSVIGARGGNRLEAFLNSQRAAGLHQVHPAELEAVEGGFLPLLAWGVIIVGQAFLAGYAVGAATRGL